MSVPENVRIVQRIIRTGHIGVFGSQYYLQHAQMLGLGYVSRSWHLDSGGLDLLGKSIDGYSSKVFRSASVVMSRTDVIDFELKESSW